MAKEEVRKEISAFAQSWLQFVNGMLSDWLRADLSDITSETDGLEEKIALLSFHFKNRPEDMKAFATMVGSQRKSKDVPPTDSAIRMFGVMNSVCHLVVCKMADVLPPKILPRDATTGMFSRPSPQILPYTQKIQKFLGEEARYRDAAFAGALLYDLMSLSILTAPSAEKRSLINAQLEIAFTRSVATIKIGLALAKRSKRLAYESSLPAAILIHELGHVCAAAHIPAYAEKLKIWRKRLPTFTERRIQESEEFGDVISSFVEALSWVSPALKQASLAASAADRPYTLDDPKERDSSDLASMCRLAYYLNEKPELLKKTMTFQAKQLRPELKGLDLTIDLAVIAKELAEAKT